MFAPICALWDPSFNDNSCVSPRCWPGGRLMSCEDPADLNAQHRNRKRDCPAKSERCASMFGRAAE